MVTLGVIIPAYNEDNTIGSVIQNIPREIDGIDDVIVIVVDDGSIDETVNESLQAGADVIVKHHTNGGVGVAFRDGVNKALELGVDILANLDADGQHDSADIPRLVNPILNDNYDVVIGSRFIDSRDLEMPWIKRLGNCIFTKLISWFIGKNLSDTQSGFRAFSKEAALRMNFFGKFTYTQESIMDLGMSGMNIHEIPIKVKTREGKSKVVKNWYSYGIKALSIILRSLRDYKPLAFFGFFGLIISIAGFSTGLFVLFHYLVSGKTSPYGSLLSFTILSILSGLFLIVLALIADMQSRHRQIQQEILYYTKLQYYKDKRNS
ncbi:MAG: glycosyltransferase [Candidatus Helarchaeota archaeon]